MESDHQSVLTTETNSRRQRQKQDRRGRICRAAFSLFESKGFDSTTVDEITGLADVAKGTFFNYFETKQSVLIEYYIQLSEKFINLIEQQTSGTCQKKFKSLFRQAEGLLRVQGPLLDILFQELFARTKLLAMDSHVENRVRKFYFDWLDKGKKSGELKKSLHVNRAAQLIIDIWSASLRNWIESNKSFSLATEINHKLKILFNGMLK